MNHPASTVSIHPYFKVHAGKLDTAKAVLRVLVGRTATEKECLYYEFTINGDVIFCREAYAGAGAALLHVENVRDGLAELLKIADLARIEVHGPAEELEKLKVPMAALNPVWFVYECGLER